MRSTAAAASLASNTQVLFDRFVISFNDADSLILAPIYAASERPIEGVNAEGLFRGIKDHGHKDVILCGSQKEMVKTLLNISEAGDVVMTLGAGDVHKVGEAFLEKLRA